MTDKNQWILISPGGNTTANIFLDERKGLSIRTSRNQQQNLECMIALETNLGIIGKQPEFMKETRASYDEVYPMPAGKEPYYHNKNNELVLLFAECDMKYEVWIRAFDEGVAYRICLLESPVLEVELISEPVIFQLDESYTKSWLQTWIDTYEGPFDYYEVKKIPQSSYAMPCLFQDENVDRWFMITEAELLNSESSYCSSHLKRMADGRFHLSFAPEQTEHLKWMLPARTPWRVLMMADGLEELLQNRMVYHLNPPSIVQDMDFIHPGRSLWSWWSFENGAQLYTEQKKYVDMAAAYGFEAITVDAGWDDTWVARLCRYARNKGVQVWLWSDMQSLDSYEKAKPKIDRWASWGVAGLKVDFFMNDSSARMEQYHTIADLMTENRLMINFHGNTKPAGEGRTWPHLMTEEGIMGLEHYKWSDMPGAIHNCTVPFTRNVIGPMDYTPTGFSNQNRNTTLGHQLALSVIFDTGVNHIAESIHGLLAFVGTDFLRRTHGAYDESRLLDGYPGSHVVMLRRKDQEWFIGGISVDRRTMELDLSFLTDGEYEALLYKDAKSKDMLEVSRLTIKEDKKVNVNIPQSGGFSLYIAPEIKPLPVFQLDGYMKTPVLEIMESELLFNVHNLPPKHYTFRIWYRAEESGIMEIRGGNQEQILLPFEQSGGKSILRTVETSMAIGSGDDCIKIGKVKGELEIDKIQIIDNNPPVELQYSALDGKLFGNAVILPIPEGEGKSVQNIGNGGSLIFDEIEVAEDGDYIMAMDYYSGENRPVDITVNDYYKTTSVLFNSGGWETGHYNILGRKEVVIPLHKGKNQIEFSGDLAAPHFSGISIFHE